MIVGRWDTMTPRTLHTRDTAAENVDVSADGTDDGGRRYVGLGRCPRHGNAWFVEFARAPMCEHCAMEDDYACVRGADHAKVLT